MSEQVVNDVIAGIENEEVRKNAISFLEYLKNEGMVCNNTCSEVSYNGKPLCYMHLSNSEEEPAPWTIWTEGDYSAEPEDFPIDMHTKEIAWKHVNYCANCGCGSQPGHQKTIFGIKFDNVCNADMAFYKPNAEELECVKKLLEMRKSVAS